MFGFLFAYIVYNVYVWGMSKQLTKLIAITQGRLSIEIDQHKLYGETAQQVIERNPEQYGKFAQEMSELDTIIRVEGADKNKPMPIVEVYHYDFDAAIKELLKQIEGWTYETK